MNFKPLAMGIIPDDDPILNSITGKDKAIYSKKKSKPSEKIDAVSYKREFTSRISRNFARLRVCRSSFTEEAELKRSPSYRQYRMESLR